MGAALRPVDRAPGVRPRPPGAGRPAQVPGERRLGARRRALRDLPRDGDPDLRGVRPHRDRARPHREPALPEPEGIVRQAGAGSGAPALPHRQGRGRRDHRADAEPHEGVLGERRGDRAGRDRRLVPHRRPGMGGRRRVPVHHGADQGRDRDRRRQERLPDGRRGDLSRDPGDRGDRRSGSPERAVRGRARRGGAGAGSRRHGGGGQEAHPARDPARGPGPPRLPPPPAAPRLARRAAAGRGRRDRPGRRAEDRPRAGRGRSGGAGTRA